MCNNWIDPLVRILIRNIWIVLIILCFSVSVRAQQTTPSHDGRTVAATPTSSETPASLDNPASVLAMMSTEPQFYRDFKFQNTAPSSVTITGADIASGYSGVKIISSQTTPLPATIAPGEFFTVRLGYSELNTHVTSDTLILTKENGSTLSYPICISRIKATFEQNGFNHRQIALSVTPDQKNRSVQVILYSGYHGNIAIYTKDGTLLDEAKNVRSYIWHTTPGKKLYDENEYVIRVTCIDGGQTLTRSETISFASK
ncbi:MAG TPA: hypothetical protein VEW28_05025 [Candidatus Kapabacteria bacterium]|nr:hypothetical protein [Candidatus Kapabacteria bacterium]